MIPPQPPHPPKAQQGSARTTWALIALIIGVVVCLLGCCTAASPYALFLLAGGGEAEGFDELTHWTATVGVVLIGLSVPLLVIGAILFALRDR